MEQSRIKGQQIYIVHALNGQEYREGPYRLDGYHKDTKTAYEFLVKDTYQMSSLTLELKKKSSSGGGGGI